jgi:hypothetical protein
LHLHIVLDTVSLDLLEKSLCRPVVSMIMNLGNCKSLTDNERAQRIS